MSHNDTFKYGEYNMGNVYRVSIQSDENSIEVACIGMNCVDAKAEGLYDLTKPLPKWLEDKLAVLMLCDPTPPTVSVDGIGRRIDEHTFWVDGQ
tara:strand:+ start:289 stop:570 length:282 start_codon:yes stop_codon:yes gene_type:complete